MILRAVVLIAALMVIGLIVALSISYTLARTNLLGTSEIAETERGVVECYREGIGSAVVIVHGTPGGYDQFLTLGRLISSHGYSVVCFSRPGYLRSPLRSNKSPADQAAIIAALMSSLSIQKASVIGISGGGPSAIKFAIDFPERTKSIVLIAALSGEPHRNLSEDDPRGANVIDDIRFLLGYTFPGIFISALGKIEKPGSGSMVDEKTRLAMASDLFGSLGFGALRNEGYLNDVCQFYYKSLNLAFEKIEAPVLLVYGEDDVTVPVRHANLIEARTAHARLTVIPDAGHPLFVTHANEILVPLLDFLGS